MNNRPPNASQQAWQRQTTTRQAADAVARQALRRQTPDPAKNAADFWFSYQPAGLDPLLTLEMKDALVYNQQNFILEAVELRPIQNRPTWVCKIDIGGEKYGAMFSDNAVRTDLYHNLKRAVEGNGPMLVGMTSFEAQPQPGYDLCAPYETDTPQITEETPSENYGIPF